MSYRTLAAIVLALVLLAASHLLIAVLLAVTVLVTLLLVHLLAVATAVIGGTLFVLFTAIAQSVLRSGYRTQPRAWGTAA